MMMRHVLCVCVCLLLAILTGCGKPRLGLPASQWTTSKPILGYQWYIDGKPVGKPDPRKARLDVIEKAVKMGDKLQPNGI